MSSGGTQFISDVNQNKPVLLGMFQFNLSEFVNMLNKKTEF